jgi:hypothetical protein
MLVDIDVSRIDPTPQRANVLLPRYLLAEIDCYAKAHGATRSGFLAEAARPDALHRRAQPGRRIMLHDSGRTLAAEHAAIDRMVAVAFDVPHLAIAKMHIDAATACTHVAGCLSDDVADRLMQMDMLFRGHALRMLLPGGLRHCHRFDRSTPHHNIGFSPDRNAAARNANKLHGL